MPRIATKITFTFIARYDICIQKCLDIRWAKSFIYSSSSGRRFATEWWESYNSDCFWAVSIDLEVLLKALSNVNVECLRSLSLMREDWIPVMSLVYWSSWCAAGTGWKLHFLAWHLRDLAQYQETIQAVVYELLAGF